MCAAFARAQRPMERWNVNRLTRENCHSIPLNLKTCVHPGKTAVHMGKGSQTAFGMDAIADKRASVHKPLRTPRMVGNPYLIALRQSGP